MSAFAVLAEANRRRILDLLRARERPVGYLVARIGLSQPAVSKHLRVLREAGLVDVRVAAQRRLYRVRPEPLREVHEWLEQYRGLWESRLDALEAHLDRMPDSATEERKWTQASKRSAGGGGSGSRGSSRTRRKKSGAR
jgi:DNA-binding transcriptional ArsR family regulator